MKRYSKGLIYTYVGDILISINPFQQLPNVYHDKVKQRQLETSHYYTEIGIKAIPWNNKNIKGTSSTSHICCGWFCLSRNVEREQRPSRVCMD